VGDLDRITIATAAACNRSGRESWVGRGDRGEKERKWKTERDKETESLQKQQ